MAAATKRIDQIRKARDRRARLLLVVLGVALAAVVALEGPKTLKMLHPKTATPKQSAASTVQPAAANNAAAATASGRLADTRVTVSPAPGQLASFGLFKTKDPFVQQVAQQTASSAASPAAAPQPVKPPVQAKPSAPVIVQMGNGGGSTPSADAAVKPGVVISINGVPVRLTVNTIFPSGDPIFRLVSFKHGRARIGLISGTFADGQKTILLVRGKLLKLVNTTAGTKYDLKLMSWS